MNDEKEKVKIDRLVLDIPGIDAAAAQRLAAGIGEHLAQAGIEGTYPRIAITLEPGGDMMTKITAALMARL
jgi:hypothetical protein